MVDRPLAGAAALFLASTAYGAVVSMRHDIPGEPLGMRAPGSVSHQVATGLGSGLSAPWPMPAATALAALASGGRRTWPHRVAVVVGGMLALGVLVEPVTWQRDRRTPHVLVSVVLNLATAAGLITAGRRSGRRPSRPGP